MKITDIFNESIVYFLCNFFIRIFFLGYFYYVEKGEEER